MFINCWRQTVTMDMLVKLYSDVIRDSNSKASLLASCEIRKPIGPEHLRVVEWVNAQFGTRWASEVQAALGNRPVSTWIATRESQLLGFACYDATARGFFGPIGVRADVRAQGIGAALLLATLRDMRLVGYGYAIVGGVGAPEFFGRVAGAVEIPESTPGLYRGMVE